jgi:Uri superfamily endonuclease
VKTYITPKLFKAVPLKGTYCLCIKNKKEKKLNIGALGTLDFPTGYYIYIGSALHSLIPRLDRHLKTSEGNHHVTHWHIDYFLKEKDVQIQSIFIIEKKDRLECKIAAKVSKHGEPVPHFGCSDCKCSSHLFIVKECNFLKKIGFKRWR